MDGKGQILEEKILLHKSKFFSVRVDYIFRKCKLFPWWFSEGFIVQKSEQEVTKVVPHSKNGRKLHNLPIHIKM